MPTIRKRKKLNIKRALLLLVSIIVVLALLISGLFYLFSSQNRKEEPIMTPEGEVVERVELTDLKARVQDVLAFKRLHDLKGSIQTYIFNNELSDLKTEILNYLSENGIDSSKISWAIQDLTTGAYIESDNADENFVAASTYKLPLCMLYYDMIASGYISPSDTIEFTEAMTEEEDAENPDQPIARKYKVGDKIQIDELLEAALVYSDNVAGHMLYENLGGYKTFKTMAAQYSDTTQDKSFTSNENLFNADYMMDLVNHLYNTTGTYDDLKYWLHIATYGMFLNDQIPYTYIQKIGNLDEVRNAIGYYSGMFPYSVSVYSAISKEVGEKALSDIGVICYNYFQNKYNSGFYADYDENLISTLSNSIGSPEDVITNRPGLNGQTLPPVTPEDQAVAEAAMNE